ncbi:hypothetical protein JCM8097_008257 [Rhodosporidiobolus ruineniae]
MSAQQGLKVALHPLPLMNLSEHYTRISINTGNKDTRVFGALLGTQQGREVDILNSFEIVVKPSGEDGNGPLEVDHAYFVTRRDQFKQVFPTFDFLGWYSIGSAPTPEDAALHKQFFEYNETPLYLQLSPPSSLTTGKDLPVTVYESTLELVDGQPTPVFVPAPFEIETGEAERVAVDHVSKPMEGGEGGASSSLIASLSTQRSALSMLHDRLKVVLAYLHAVTSGKARKDPETLRQIAALVASLPGALDPAEAAKGKGKEVEAVGESEKEGGEQGEFEKEFLTEYNDVLLTNYLAALTKQLLTANELLDKQLLLVTAPSGSSAGGGEGGGGRSTRSGGGGGRKGYGGGAMGKFAGDVYA